jgi:hypothetical protein
VFLSKRVWLGVFRLSTCALLLVTCSRAAFAFSSYPGTTAVPEIDPTAAVSGLMLCAGSAMILIERYRHRK